MCEIECRPGYNRYDDIELVNGTENGRAFILDEHRGFEGKIRLVLMKWDGKKGTKEEIMVDEKKFLDWLYHGLTHRIDSPLRDKDG